MLAQTTVSVVVAAVSAIRVVLPTSNRTIYTKCTQERASVESRTYCKVRWDSAMINEGTVADREYFGWFLLEF